MYIHVHVLFYNVHGTCTLHYSCRSVGGEVMCTNVNMCMYVYVYVHVLYTSHVYQHVYLSVL